VPPPQKTFATTFASARPLTFCAAWSVCWKVWFSAVKRYAKPKRNAATRRSCTSWCASRMVTPRPTTGISTSARARRTPPKKSLACLGRIAISREMYVSTPRLRNTISEAAS
jgi:hypothetical protein